MKKGIFLILSVLLVGFGLQSPAFSKQKNFVVSILSMIRSMPDSFLEMNPGISRRTITLQHDDGRKVKVSVWTPGPMVERKGLFRKRFVEYPLIVFSFGGGDCPFFLPDVIVNLVKERGYMLAVADHPDLVKICEIGKFGNIDLLKFIKGMASMPSMEDVTSEEAGSPPSLNTALTDLCGDRDAANGLCSYRSADMKLIIDELIKNNRRNNPILSGIGKINVDQIVVSGHSLGGHSAMGVAGANPLYKDNRVKGVLSIDSGSYIFEKRDIENVDVPVMMITSDESLLPAELQSNTDEVPHVFYSWLRSEKYFLSIRQLSHPGFVALSCSELTSSIAPGLDAGGACDDLGEKFGAIRQYSKAFLDHVLKHDQAAAEFLGETAPVSDWVKDYEYSR